MHRDQCKESSIWLTGIKGVPRLIYRGETVTDPASDAHLVEGEANADDLADEGFAAIHIASVQGVYVPLLEQLRNRLVYIWVDHDDVGEQKAKARAAALAGIASSVKIIRPAEHAVNPALGYDVGDAIKDG